MLCLAVLVFTLSCHTLGDSGRSAPARAHVAALRRQLMRDNYDYPHSGAERAPPGAPGTAHSERPKKLNNQKTESDHLSRASELSQSNSKFFSAEQSQQEQSQQHEQSDEHDHRDEYEPELLGQPTIRSQDEPRIQYDQRGQNEQYEQGEHQEQQLEQQRPLNEHEQQPAQRIAYNDSGEPASSARSDSGERPGDNSDRHSVSSERDQRGNYNNQYGQDGEADARNDQKEQEQPAPEKESSSEEDRSSEQENTRVQESDKQAYDQSGGSQQSLVSNNEQLRRGIFPSKQGKHPPAAARPPARPLARPPTRPPAGPARAGGTSAAPRTAHWHRNFVVTVSAANVTYKLLTLHSRDGRRLGERRILEEQAPGGVAIISLDKAPLPALRLPRSRRQYMHAWH